MTSHTYKDRISNTKTHMYTCRDTCKYTHTYTDTYAHICIFGPNETLKKTKDSSVMGHLFSLRDLQNLFSYMLFCVKPHTYTHIPTHMAVLGPKFSQGTFTLS